LKPPPFSYSSPERLDEALDLLAEHGDDAKVLAGGQSLVPLLNFRLARPAHIIDINRIGELSYTRRRDGVLHIGALTRQAMLERSRVVREGWPVLRDAVGLVAHAQIRNRGTVGGSVAHADPSAELPTVFTALDARFHVRSARATRSLPWDDFFVTHLMTAMEPDELLTEVEVPAVAPGSGAVFLEYARRNGDFALGGVAAIVTLDEERRCSAASIALLGAADTPVRAREAEAAMAGRSVDAALADEVAAEALRGVEPTGDIHGSSAYRRKLLQGLVTRAIMTAAGRAE
jgi:carbon-monoxide dehydrogenase medium subunit/6-hydroxypseudooxynicotine dehydrogenase subunit alpha